MNHDDHPLQAKRYLNDLCCALERGRRSIRRPGRWWLVPLVPAALSLGVTACAAYAAPCEPGACEVYDAGADDEDASDEPSIENCSNFKDDDGDGKTDCADEDCAGAPGC